MGDFPDSLIPKDSILVSRNRPVAFIVGVAGFLGSHLAEHLLSKNIQVIGVDDFSTGVKENLSHCVKSKDFHLINRSVEEPSTFASLKLPRIDYVFWVADQAEVTESLFSKGLLNVLNFIKDNNDYVADFLEKGNGSLKIDLKHKPRIVFVSSVNLYGSKLTFEEKILKEGEIRFARFVKYHKLNGRIVRVTAIYGPRMHFRTEEPVVKLIQASLLEKLHDFPTSTDFSTRALYIDDVVHLIIKSALSGATSQKIYDASNLHPVKVAEIKQILLDPLWHEMKHFKPSELPPWPTPNLLKTMKELSWKPKEPIIEGLKNAIAYFKDHEVKVPDLDKKEDLSSKRWSFAEFRREEGNSSTDEKEPHQTIDEGKGDLKKTNFKVSKFSSKILFLAILLIIGYGLIYPLVRLGVGVFSIRQDLKRSGEEVALGNFTKAQSFIADARNTLDEARGVANSLVVLKRLGIMRDQLDKVEQIISLVDDGIEGVSQAISGTESLYQTTKIVSGEEPNQALKPLFEKAQADLTSSSQKLSRVRANLSDKTLTLGLPPFLVIRLNDLNNRLEVYSNLVDKARSASLLLPQMIAIEGEKSYLVLLPNNLQLRPSGGVVGNYAKLTFERGRIKDIKVDETVTLDSKFSEVVNPPQDLRTDLGQNRLLLKDSLTEADFPTSARSAEFLYKKESGGDLIGGIFSLDLTGVGNLLEAVGGVDIPNTGEHIDQNNLLEKTIAHASDSSQINPNQPNFLTEVETQLFNKLFFVSSQNWPKIIEAIGNSLDQKHLVIYLSDPTLFSYLASENWAGILPRGAEGREGVVNDFLYTTEANYGQNYVNYYLDRGYNLETSINNEGLISHKLVISYKNNSPQESFPGGNYKERFKLYLPLGARLLKASFGEQDITSQFSSFVDYGRTGYSVLLNLSSKEQKNLNLEYELAKKLEFKDGKSGYRLDVIKQPGNIADPFELTLNYPANLKLISADEEAQTNGQILTIPTNLVRDRSFFFSFQNP
jgi:UDP-glucuronate decarboxylase